MLNFSQRFSVLIFISLFIAMASFASKPLPAAGAGPSCNASSDLKHAQERSDKTRKALEKLVEEMHSNQPTPEQLKYFEEKMKLENQEQREGATCKALFRWKTSSVAKDKWVEELTVTTEKPDRVAQLITHYSFAAPQALNPIKLGKFNFICNGHQSEQERLRLLLELIAFRQAQMLNHLARNGHIEALSVLIDNAFCISPSGIYF